MLKNTNRNVLIVALIALVNMLGYGIIIPILYAYSKKFGLTDFQNGLLFASFSVGQFIATPIIGRLSDKYGRKPLLLISIAGTAVSFFMMAFAPSAIFLFLARLLDGLTAGNIPVAFAVISDSTKQEERAKAFGLIMAGFNFGFVFGPAISAFTVGIYAALPFIIAGVVALIAVAITWRYLPETNTHMGEVKAGKLFDFKKLVHTLVEPNVGPTFLISLIFFLAFAAAVIYGFQPFLINFLHISETQNSILFTIFGAIGLLAQTFLVHRVTKRFGLKKAFSGGILLTALAFFLMFFANSLTFFLIPMIILAVVNNITQTLFPTILSAETDAKSQGSIMGLNSSYQSLGFIAGPILGGLIATVSIRLPFLFGAGLIMICYFLSFRVLRRGVHKESAF